MRCVVCSFFKCAKGDPRLCLSRYARCNTAQLQARMRARDQSPEGGRTSSSGGCDITSWLACGVITRHTPLTMVQYYLGRASIMMPANINIRVFMVLAMLIIQTICIYVYIYNCIYRCHSPLMQPVLQTGACLSACCLSKICPQIQQIQQLANAIL